MHGSHRTVRRGMLVGVVYAIVLSTAVPAFAVDYVYDSGSRYCPGTSDAGTRSYSTGTTRHSATDLTTNTVLPSKYFYNGASMRVRTKVWYVSDIYWTVRTDGILNDPGTYAFCTGIE